MNLHNNEEMFLEIIELISIQSKINPLYLEKDYYLTLLLKEIVSIDNNFVFKGGTCLSKCFKVIDRFSEDIDIGYDPDIKLTDGIKRRNRDKLVKAIKNVGLVLKNREDIRGRRQFNRYLLDYAKSVDVESNDQIILESSYISKTYPIETKTIQSIIGEVLEQNNRYDLIEEFGLQKFEIKCQSLTRTFVDKIFAICDYYLIDRLERNSRHMYDLYMLYPLVKNDKEFPKLFNEIKEIRKTNDRCYSANDDYSIKLLLKEIYESNFYKSDYSTITRNLLFKSIDYKKINDNLLDIIDMIPVKKGEIGYGKAYFNLYIKPELYDTDYEKYDVF